MVRARNQPDSQEQPQDTTSFLPLPRGPAVRGRPAAGMLYAQLQLRLPDARSVLLAAARSSVDTMAVARTLALTAASAGAPVRLVDVSGTGRLGDSPPGEGLQTATISPERLWQLEAARSSLAAFEGLTVAAGAGVLDNPTTLLASAAADAVLLVARRGKTAKTDLERARREIERSGGRLVGAVLIE